MSRPNAPVNTTKSGRRWLACPNCMAVSARIPLNAPEHKCRHCDAEFDLREKDAKAPKPRKRKKTVIPMSEDPANAASSI